MTSLSWRIYYDDGSTFDNAQSSPRDAPAYGVICIVFANELIGRKIAHLKDFYYWVPDERQWWGSDIFGLLDQMSLRDLVSRVGDQWSYLHYDLPMERDQLVYRLIDDGYIKLGRSVSSVTFREIMEIADKDPDFPPMSGKLKESQC